jgi:arginase
VFRIIGASFGLGSSKKGSAFGPHVLLSHGLLEALKQIDPTVELGGVVTPSYLSEGSDGSPKNLKEFLSFDQDLRDKIEQCYLDGKKPLVLGGDHAISITTIETAAKVTKKRIGALWIDSHTDINDEKDSPSGNIHGMTVRALLGEVGPINRKCLKVEDITYIAVRDIDPPEREYLKRKGIKLYTMRDIDARGIGPIATEAIKDLSSKVDGVIASFDLDACDPEIAPGVGTPVPGGLTERESHFIMEEIALIPNLLSLELVEYNPELDKDEKTAKLAIRLLQSGLGKTII